MFKKDLKLRQIVFEKMGWEPGLKMDQGQWWLVVNLPMVEKRWEVTAKYLVPFMRGKGYEYDIEGGEFFWMYPSKPCTAYKKIKDDNIAEAACQAFMEVEI